LCKENSFKTENDYFYQKIRKMQQTLDITRTSRTVSQMLAGYTLDQLNTIQKDTVIFNLEYCSYHRRAADVSL
jgi:hypothetical protein